MNPLRRIYSARIAPASRDRVHAVRAGVQVVEPDGLWIESFDTSPSVWRKSTWKNAGQHVPVILSHDSRKRVGHVIALGCGGGWWEADFVLDWNDPHVAARDIATAADLAFLGCSVSVGFDPLDSNDDLPSSANGIGVRRYTVVRLNELSLLNRNELAKYPGARIVRAQQLTPAAHVVDGLRVEPGETLLDHGAGILYRNVDGELRRQVRV